MMCDKFFRRYEELEVLTKESYETIQKNLEYYHELQDAFDDIDFLLENKDKIERFEETHP